MIDYGTVKSTKKPEPIVIDEKSVWEHSNIHEITETDDEGNEFKQWEYNMIRYDKNEFILNQANENTNLQLALCEVYEMLS